MHMLQCELLLGAHCTFGRWLIHIGSRVCHCCGVFVLYTLIFHEISVYNNAFAVLNEITWGEVSIWEQLHRECDDPRLLRFLGRPDDLR